MLDKLKTFLATIPTGASLTTIAIWEGVHEELYERDIGASPGDSANAAFGSLISKHSIELGLVPDGVHERAHDSLGGATHTARWRKT